MIRVTPGVGLRARDAARAAAASTWPTTPIKLQAGPLFQFDEHGALTLVPGQGDYVLDRDGRITVHFAVGQPF